MITDAPISGLILAGGQGQRLDGQDKGLVLVADLPMVSHVIERFSSQVQQLAISANRNLDQYRRYGFTVLTDESPTFEGPLAGISAGLDWCPSPLLAIAPCDSPQLPSDLVARLCIALERENTEIAMAVVEGKRQPVFALLKKSLQTSLSEFLDAGERKIGKWYESRQLSKVIFEKADEFANINTERDRRKLESSYR